MMTSREFLHRMFYKGKISIVPSYADDEICTGRATPDFWYKNWDKIQHITDRCFAYVDDELYDPLIAAGQFVFDTFESQPENTPYFMGGRYVWMFQRVEEYEFEDFVLDLLEPWMLAQKNLMCGRIIARAMQRPQTLKSARKLNGLSQQALADMSGVNVSLIRKIESGAVNLENVTAKNIFAIADTLSIPPQALIASEDTVTEHE